MQAPVLPAKGAQFGLPEQRVAVAWRAAERTAVSAGCGDDDASGRAEIVDQGAGIAGGNDDDRRPPRERREQACKPVGGDLGDGVVADLTGEDLWAAVRAYVDEYQIIRSRLIRGLAHQRGEG